MQWKNTQIPPSQCRRSPAHPIPTPTLSLCSRGCPGEGSPHQRLSCWEGELFPDSQKSPEHLPDRKESQDNTPFVWLHLHQEQPHIHSACNAICPVQSCGEQWGQGQGSQLGFACGPSLPLSPCCGGRIAEVKLNTSRSSKGKVWSENKVVFPDTTLSFVLQGDTTAAFIYHWLLRLISPLERRITKGVGLEQIEAQLVTVLERGTLPVTAASRRQGTAEHCTQAKLCSPRKQQRGGSAPSTACSPLAELPPQA